MLRADQEKLQTGKSVYYAMRAYMTITIMIGGTIHLFVPYPASGYIFAVFVFILPLPMTALFAYWSQVENQQKGIHLEYDEVWHYVFNGYFGYVFKHAKEIINHDKKRPMSGAIFEGMSGMVRWLCVPFMASVTISTLISPEVLNVYAAEHGDPVLSRQLTPQLYPEWVVGLAKLLTLMYMTIVLIGSLSPKSLAWFTQSSSNAWHSLFQRRSYGFGLLDIRDKAHAESKEEKTKEARMRRGSVTDAIFEHMYKSNSNLNSSVDVSDSKSQADAKTFMNTPEDFPSILDLGAVMNYNKQKSDEYDYY